MHVKLSNVVMSFVNQVKWKLLYFMLDALWFLITTTNCSTQARHHEVHQIKGYINRLSCAYEILLLRYDANPN